MGNARPDLIVVARSAFPDSGSEPGKGFQWTQGLSRLYNVHLAATEKTISLCRPDPRCHGWHFLPPVEPDPPQRPLSYYAHYRRWCRRLIPHLKPIIQRVRPCGLHHIVLGSFRVLPRYDRLGIPYTLGPLGGGECAPWEYLRGAGVPWHQFALEAVRPALNYGFRVLPGLRRVFRHASLTLATTSETEAVLRALGARRTVVVFPDALEADVDRESVRAHRRRQMESICGEVCLVWSGRFLWWKGGQLALHFLRRLREHGIRARLRMHTQEKGVAYFRKEASRLGVQEFVTVGPFVPRGELLRVYLDSHLFVYPSMHDSSSSAVLEAYATGLPTMTLGVGGVAVAASMDAGLNRRFPDLETWYREGVKTVSRWREDPAIWFAAAEAALDRCSEFLPSKLDEVIRTHLSRDRVYDT